MRISKIPVVALMMSLVLLSAFPLSVCAYEVSNTTSIEVSAESILEISVETNEATESVESFDDSHIEVEEAEPDYSIIFTLIIGFVLGGLILYVLLKPQKKPY